MKQTLREQWIKLSTVRNWVADRLPTENDKQTRNALFEAQKAIGFALLYLEEVELRTDGAYSSAEEESPPIG